jgi:Protein of unknown function (DUF1569)
MYPRRSLIVPANVEELIVRLGRLEPTTPRRWGRMSAPEMLCHLADLFRVAFGEKQASSVENWFLRTVVKWIAINTVYPWPQGVPTRPELDPQRAGTKPADFDRDRQVLNDLIRRFAKADGPRGRHPGFGAMTRDEWLFWGYGHVDHHLRQFGL